MRALLLIDIQNDFLPGGALAVPHGDEVIEVANRLMGDYEIVVATQDWHPADHLSFASQHPGHQRGDIVHLDGLRQVLWPDHCVQDSAGAQFPSSLHQGEIDHVVRKGTDRRVDSYSGFYDNARRHATQLDGYLRSHHATEVHIVGLATDYCVKATALDAIDLGYSTTVISEGVRGVELHAGDCERAFAEMRAHGVSIA